MEEFLSIEKMSKRKEKKINGEIMRRKVPNQNIARLGVKTLPFCKSDKNAQAKRDNP